MKSYTERLKEERIFHSMSRKGSCLILTVLFSSEHPCAEPLPRIRALAAPAGFAVHIPAAIHNA